MRARDFGLHLGLNTRLFLVASDQAESGVDERHSVRLIQVSLPCLDNSDDAPSYVKFHGLHFHPYVRKESGNIFS